MEGVRKSAQQFSRGRMIAEIYAIPEDTNAKGEKKWQRTRELLEAEKGILSQPYEVRLINDRPYAVRRERASAAAGRGKKARGDVHYINPVRESHWRDELLEAFQPLLMDLYHDTMLAILKRTGD